MTLHTEYLRLIEQTDVVLKEKRRLWLAAKEPQEAQKWRTSLDETLDERFRLMKCRDAAKEVGA